MIVVALLGGVAGLAAGEISRRLAAGWRAGGRPDRLSWLLAVGGAVAMTAYPGGGSGGFSMGAVAGLVGLLLLVLACDVRERAVYPAIVFPGIVAVAVAAPMLGGSIVDALLGAVAGAGLFGVLYLLARLRYGPGALGDGDISAAALLGAVVGLSQLAPALALASLIGLALALLVGLRARSLRASFPYAPVLCLAGLAVALLRTA